MELLPTIIVTLQITSIIAKRHYSSSDESIENLLYYKDCKHKLKEPSTEKPTERPTEPPPRQPACPCPRMCCSMCCDCSAPTSFMGRQMQPLQEQTPLEPVMPQLPPRQMPVQPQLIGRQGKRRKRPNAEQLNMLNSPIGGRRDLSFTRANIKSLIAQDQDIKKILKDLVRVTMQKVDLLEAADPNGETTTVSEPTNKSEDEYE